MLSTLTIAFISLISLITLHEIGHFLLAKKFGVKVEEFGIGYPPRIIAKKIGETTYSLNLLPFGAFVSMKGETSESSDLGSFSKQSVGKRFLIALGGVLSFWIIAAIIFSIVFGMGAPVAIEDEEAFEFSNPKVNIMAVAKDSPAEIAGLKVGDVINGFEVGGTRFDVTRIKEVKDITDENKGQELTLIVKRGKEVFQISLIPRVSPPANEGPMGVALIRTAIQKYPWYLAPLKGIKATGEITLFVIQAYIQAIENLFIGQPLGIEMVGPVGVLQILAQSQQLGIIYFFNLLALISIQLAIFNLLPIPAVDGGRIMFLAIEAVRKKPVSQKTQQKMIVFSFITLLLIMVWVTIKDVSKLF